MKNIEYVMKYKNNAKLNKEDIIETLCPTDIDCKLIQLDGNDCIAPINCNECWSLEYKI